MTKPVMKCPHGPSLVDLRRNFSYKEKMIIISVGDIGSVLEVRGPLLQIVQDEVDILVRKQRTTADGDIESHKKSLRREIRHWWEAVADCLDDLVSSVFL
jgi:hypothetical protein